MKRIIFLFIVLLVVACGPCNILRGVRKNKIRMCYPRKNVIYLQTQKFRENYKSYAPGGHDRFVEDNKFEVVDMYDVMLLKNSGDSEILISNTTEIAANETCSLVNECLNIDK